jgi:hypothetical protein
LSFLAGHCSGGETHGLRGRRRLQTLGSKTRWDQEGRNPQWEQCVCQTELPKHFSPATAGPRKDITNSSLQVHRPTRLLHSHEAMMDLEDGRVAYERLADLDAGRTTAVPADGAAQALEL